MTTQTLAKLYTDSFHKNWTNSAFSDYEGKTLTYSEVAITIKSLHLFYQILGLRQGDKIAVLGRNSANWGTLFLSAISAGIIIVPILPDFNNSNTNHIINHSEVRIVVGAKSLLEKVDFEKAEKVEVVLVLEDFSLHAARGQDMEYKLADSFEYYKKNKLTKAGFQFEEWDREDTCIISYTSGTSGFTKGVMIPERSLVSNIVYAQEHMPLNP
ncbi:MAG TPA: AMP-binding protein, partial [Draconibacterium sp.]|nr:AMP-binding protein [Draconibacterium sp.]